MHPSGCAASGRSASISDLIEAVAPVTPRGADSKFLAKLFQAIRIEVNGEMDALEMMLEQALRVLRPGRTVGGDHLSFARRPARQKFHA